MLRFKLYQAVHHFDFAIIQEGRGKAAGEYAAVVALNFEEELRNVNIQSRVSTT